MVGKDTDVLVWLINRLKHGGPWTVFLRGLYRERLWMEMSRAGVDSLAIVTVISAASGVILALQASIQLMRVGAVIYVANMVSITIIRELGPILTAVIATGRSGAAYAAEIATMNIGDELDALEVMGLDPVSFLVWPKLVALVMVLPCLTLWSDMVGIFAGGALTVSFTHVDAGQYFEQTVEYMNGRDLLTGLVKSSGFAGAVTLIGCWQGFLARGGASEVGARTTSAVVQSIFAIILLDLLFTIVIYLCK